MLSDIVRYAQRAARLDVLIGNSLVLCLYLSIAASVAISKILPDSYVWLKLLLSTSNLMFAIWLVFDFLMGSEAVAKSNTYSEKE